MKTFIKQLMTATLFWVVILTMNSSCSEYGDGTENYGTNPGSNIDMKLLNQAASSVEQAFKKADTASLAAILSESSLSHCRPYFLKLIPYMTTFGNAYATRKFLHATERFAVFEFTLDGKTLTTDFCLGDDGKWLLTRF